MSQPPGTPAQNAAPRGQARRARRARGGERTPRFRGYRTGELRLDRREIADLARGDGQKIHIQLWPFRDILHARHIRFSLCSAVPRRSRHGPPGAANLVPRGMGEAHAAPAVHLWVVTGAARVQSPPVPGPGCAARRGARLGSGAKRCARQPLSLGLDRRADGLVRTIGGGQAGSHNKGDTGWNTQANWPRSFWRLRRAAF